MAIPACNRKKTFIDNDEEAQSRNTDAIRNALTKKDTINYAQVFGYAPRLMQW